MISVLLIVNSFAPTNTCGSIPNTKLVKYFAREDVKITLVTDEIPTNRQLDEKLVPKEVERIRILRAGQSGFYLKTVGKAGKEMKESGVTLKLKSEVRPLRAFAVSVIKNAYFRFQEYDWLFTAKKELWKTLKKDHFDVVYSTYPGVQAHRFACAVMRAGIADRWIADFRDPMSYLEYDRFKHGRAMKLQHRIERAADYITVVSEGAMKKFLPEDLEKGKIAYLPNGFDPEDLQVDPNEAQVSPDLFRLFYAGSLYSGRRDLTVLFRAIGELAGEGKLDLSKIRVEYAGNEWPVLLSYAKKYDLESICRNYGYITRHRVMEILSEVDCSIVCSHNTSLDQGVVTGKVFELLLAEKPIVAVITGDVPGSELGSIVEDCEAGIVYEQAREADFPKLKQWILNAYQSKMDRGTIPFDLKTEVRDQYSYQNIAKRLYEICLDLTEKHGNP